MFLLIDKQLHLYPSRICIICQIFSGYSITKNNAFQEIKIAARLHCSTANFHQSAAALPLIVSVRTGLHYIDSL